MAASRVSVADAKQAIPLIKQVVELLEAPQPFSKQFLEQPSRVLNAWIQAREREWFMYDDLLDQFPGRRLVPGKRFVEALNLAACRGHFDVCRWIMAAKQPPTSRGAPESVVQLAAKHGLLYALRFLTTHGNNLDGVWENKCKAVELAASEDQLAVLQLFREWGLGVQHMRPAFLAACAHGNTNILHFLKDDYHITADQVRSCGHGRNDALTMAAFHDQVHVLRFLRDKWGLTVEDALDWDDSDVCLAIQQGHTKVCQFFEAWGRFTIDVGRPLLVDMQLAQAFDTAAIWLNLNRGDDIKDHYRSMCLWVLRVAGQHGIPAWTQLFDLAVQHNLTNAITVLRAHPEYMPWVQRQALCKKQ
jgi:hypothetical protein